MPKEDKATLDNASEFGKDFITITSQSAARTAIGFSYGDLEELEAGTSTVSNRVWSPKTIADYVKAGDTTNLNEAKTYTDTEISNAKTVVNVKDFGAVGDGTTNDEVAVRTALESIRDAGGGKLIFPRGTYFINSAVQVFSNTVIEGNGATFIKKVGQGSTMIFAILGGPGYGVGGKNITFRDLNFKGDFTTGRQIGLVGANHADNILVENCVFDEAHKQGHILDLQGCRYVTVRDCIFYGQDVVNSVDVTKECIQADNSTYLGTSAQEDRSAYDGLPCKYITLESCKFLPKEVAGVAYPAPIPFGSHWALEKPHENLSFINNTVIDSGISTETGSYRGILHFAHAKNIKVTGNHFESTSTDFSPSIFRNIPLTWTINPEEAGTATESTKQLNPPLQCSNIIISGNTFKGFTNSSQTMLDIDGAYTSSRVEYVNISNNIFIDNVGESSQGGLCVECYDINYLTVSNNISNNSRDIAAFGRASYVTVVGNSLMQDSKTGSGGILVGGVTKNVQVSSNNIKSKSYGIQIANSAESVNVSSNFIENETNASIYVPSDNTTGKILIANNQIKTAGTYGSNVTAVNNMIY